MAPLIEAITPSVELCEGPHWHAPEQALYFVGILGKTIHRYHPATKRHTSSNLEGMPKFLIPLEGKPHHFVSGLERRVVEIEWDGSQDSARVLRTIAEVDLDNPTNSLNDAKADPRGRLFAGTMGFESSPGNIEPKKGGIYRIDADGSAHKLVSGITLSNGLCWDAKEGAFYHVDTFSFAVTRYDYDIDTGNISNPRVVFSCKENRVEGFPDGMTVDTDGNLWLGIWDGGQVVKIDPRAGKLLDRLQIPAKQTTSASFGGANLDELFVTSACVVNQGGEQPPPAGAAFRVTGLGVRGYASVSVKLD